MHHHRHQTATTTTTSTSTTASTTSPRRTVTTTSPRSTRTDQPRSPLKHTTPTRLLRPRRTSKPPESDTHLTKPLSSPPPKPEDPPELTTPTIDPPPLNAPSNTQVFDEEEKGSDAFDDKGIDLPEENKQIVQIHQPKPSSKYPQGHDPPPEIKSIVEKSGAVESISPEPELGYSGTSNSISNFKACADLSSEEEDENEEEEEKGRSMQEAENRMQRIVDLVMWRDVSRSALVFGMGTFFFVSSSYTRDLHLSFISVVSYVGLFYLAAIFLWSSVFRREEEDFGGSKPNWLVGEEEALWAIRFLLPYVNEVLTKLRSLFSGDPSTTMKMAILLFALARCGGFITIWTMGKLAFFGMFTIPRFCASYSSQISRYGTFWLDRSTDAWKSCTHKKAALAAIFTLFWNLSSVPARIWSAFMLAVAVRYYQQHSLQGWGYDNVDGMNEENDEKMHHDYHETREDPGVQCKTSHRPPVEFSRRGQVGMKVATMETQEARGRRTCKLEIGSKERKKE